MPYRNITKLNILAVEDSEDDILIFKSVAYKCPNLASIHFAREGTEAICYLLGMPPFDDRAQYPVPNLLLLDLNMPGRLNGFDVLRWLQQHPGHAVVPTIVLTASSDPGDVQRAYDLGATAYLVKPGGLDDFYMILEALGHFWVLVQRPERPQARQAERSRAEVEFSLLTGSKPGGAGPAPKKE